MSIDVDRVRETVDLIDLVSRVVELRREAANEWAGPCPKCGGTDRLHVKRDWWFCRQCYPPDAPGVGHDAIGWLRWLEGLSFRDACDRLAGGAAATVPTGQRRQPETPARVYRWGDPAWQAEARRFVAESQERLDGPDGAPAREYLAGRGLRPETWRAWGLGYAMPRHPHLQEPQPAIVLPWQGRGVVKAVQYRFFGKNIGKADRFAQRPGGERTLYGVDLAQRRETCLLCEGEFNAMSVWQAVQETGATLDVLSFGSEAGAAKALAGLTGRYRRLIVWCDDADTARTAMAGIPGVQGLRSPVRDGLKLDANVLLQSGALTDFLRSALERIAAREVADVLGDAGRPLTDRLAAGLAWLREREDAHDTGGGYPDMLGRWLRLLADYQRQEDAAACADPPL